MGKGSTKVTERQAVRAIKAAAPADKAGLLRDFKSAVMRDRSFKTRLMTAMGRMPGNGYLEYVNGLEEPDLTSTILVQIPAYRDGELLKTIESARGQAANPDRIKFAVCLQDVEENRHILDGIPGLKYTFIPVGEATGSCRARYECQELYDGEDFIFITDSHMRFALFWDVAEIDQWRACGDPKAILSEYSEDYAPMAGERPTSDKFTAEVKPYGGYVGASYFWEDSCTLCMWCGGWSTDKKPFPGAFMGCAHVFGTGDINKIRFDPGMCFMGDEFAMAVRYWTHGFNIYHPGRRYVYHFNPQTERQVQSGHRSRHTIPGRDGTSPREREVARMEQLFGLADHGIDLGPYGLGRERTLAEYEAYSGVCLAKRTFRLFSHHGPFGTEHTPEQDALFDWQDYGFRHPLPVAPRTGVKSALPQPALDKIKAVGGDGGVLPGSVLDDMVRRFVAAKTAGLGPEDTFRLSAAARLSRLPGSAYLKWLLDIENPDLSSGISVEIPAFEDPELQKTVKSALAMAASPDRVHFAVCLQGGTEDDAAYLDSLPNCKYTRYAAEDAPGLCAARADCQSLTGDEDFTFRIDSHMRFAWGWDVALIRQWRECYDSTAILTEHPLNYDTLVHERADSDLFTKNATHGSVAVLNANHFAEASMKLRIQCLCVCQSDKPVRGAFTAGGMCFLPTAASWSVPFDRDMYFVADECAMAVRHYTHGHNVYHPYVRCIYHLYDRAKVLKDADGEEVPRFAPVKTGPDGLTQGAREAARLEELFGLTPEGKYGLGPGTEYGLGTERTLEEFEAYSGVSFRDFSIRKFAREGRFDTDHGPEDMAFVDWAADKRSKGQEVMPGQPTELVLKKETLAMLEGWQMLHGTPLDILLRQAVEAYAP